MCVKWRFQKWHHAVAAVHLVETARGCIEAGDLLKQVLCLVERSIDVCNEWKCWVWGGRRRHGLNPCHYLRRCRVLALHMQNSCMIKPLQIIRG
jgi:hypothetical protein